LFDLLPLVHPESKCSNAGDALGLPVVERLGVGGVLPALANIGRRRQVLLHARGRGDLLADEVHRDGIGGEERAPYEKRDCFREPAPP
jgi:hypothetical protein